MIRSAMQAIRSVTHPVLARLWQPVAAGYGRAQLVFESRKRSVPGRVHSVLKNYGFPVSAETESNPWLTHGTVESL